MRMIFKIARTELRNLFYSPVAWFLTVVFMIVCAVFYSGVAYKIALTQDMVTRNMPKFKDFDMSLTKVIFLKQDGIFSNVLNNLYLFVPLLTMGLISREINNGTFKLLYSSPVKLRQIVLGKYLAIMIYNLLLLAVLGIFLVTGFFSIKSADYGILLSATLGFYLLICAYAAIGMFMSSLSTYQIVSAIATFVLLFVLSRIGGLWQQYDFVRDLTYFLALNGRVNKMLVGLITTNDLIYFALIAFMFISFTIFRLKGGRESKPWYTKAIRYAAVLLSVVFIGYIASRPGYIGYWDTTANKTNTIDPKTQSLLKEMGNDQLEVTLYSNLLGAGINRARPEHRNDYVWNLWEKYVRFKPDIKFNYVLYYDVKDGDSNVYKQMPGKNLQQIAEEIAKVQETNIDRYIGPKEIRKMIDLQPENLRVVMHVKYKGRSMFLRTFDDPTFWPDEDHVAAVLKRLLEGKGPNVYYATGNLERDIYKTGEREYFGHSIKRNLRTALINHGFFFDTVNLDQQNVPSDVTTLVLADPKVDLSTNKIDKLKSYINSGGNLMVLGEPGKQQVVEPVINVTGARLMPGTMVEVSKNEMPHMIQPYWTTDLVFLVPELKLGKIKEAMIGGDTARALHPGASPVAVADSGFTVKHIMVTKGKNTWVKAGKLVTDSAAPVFAVQEGDYKLDSFNVSVALSRNLGKKEQRILISGDADYLSTTRPGTHALGTVYYCWLENAQYPLPMIKPKAKDVLMTIGLKAATIQRTTFVWILPAAVLLLGTVLLIRRKRQ